MLLPKKYSQYDSRWGSILLGFNTEYQYNIYNYGCLLCCLSMVGAYYSEDLNPKELNEELKKVGGFTNGGDYVWGTMQKIYTNVHEVLIRVGEKIALSNLHMEQIRDSLDKGYPVMLHIDYNPKTVKDDMHWVLAVDYNSNDENDITIVDPLGGMLCSLKKYLGWFRPSARNSIIDYVIYTGKTLAGVNLSEIPIDFNDGEGKRKKIGWYVYEWFNEKKQKIEEIEKYAKLNDSFDKYKTDFNKVLSGMQVNLDKANQDYLKIDKKYSKSLEEIDKLMIKIGEKDDRISELLKDKEVTLSEALQILGRDIKNKINATIESIIKKIK